MTGHMEGGRIIPRCTPCRSADRHRLATATPEIRQAERKRGRDKYYRLYAGTSHYNPELSNNRWIVRHPVEHRAHVAVYRAVKSGALIREPCEVCGDPKSEGHHDDYSKPLEVRWLCRKHHAEIHRLDYTPVLSSN